jgi:hypothetical protein
MRLLTLDAWLACAHAGKMGLVNAQSWVTIESRPVLVRPDPEGRSITGCPNIGLGIKPCTLSLKVQEGYSDWVRIDGKPVCLDTVTGLTDGTPPGVVKYLVRAPGQSLVSEGG